LLLPSSFSLTWVYVQICSLFFQTYPFKAPWHTKKEAKESW
jgi:hypothetical protein